MCKISCSSLFSPTMYHLSLEKSTVMAYHGQSWTMPLAATACHSRPPLFINTSSAMPKKNLIAYKNDRFRFEPTRCSQLQVSDHRTENHEEPESTVRPLGNFLPCLWGDRFSSFTLNPQLYEKYSKEVEVLKEEVKDMLVAVGKPAEKMVLIDALERLGVSYLFEKEIEELLESMFPNFEEYSHVFEDDLFMVSLHFRVFRQHGYNLSSGVFEKFKDNGEFKKTISNDVMGIVSLYEATYLKTHGEDILDEAFCFTKATLESLKPTLNPDLGERVAHALYQSLQRGIPRVEARYYISFYEKDPSANEKLLRLAKIDFNRLQMLHKEELCHISRWWKDLDLRPHVPYARDRAVEVYLSAVATYFQPQFALARLIHTKNSILISVLDDTYDAYGTYEELKLFTNTVQRWDNMVANDQLPKYMKALYTALRNSIDESTEEMSKQERTCGVHCLEEALKELVRCNNTEAEWRNEGHVPPFDEYLYNGMVTVTGPIIVASAVMGMGGEIATHEAFQWLQSKPRIVMDYSTISRILNDIMSHEGEEKKGHGATGIHCYMKQYGVSKSEAIDELYKRAENAWKDINKEMIRPTAVSKDLLMLGLNSARIIDAIYHNFDGYTRPEGMKDLVLALVGDPIPM